MRPEPCVIAHASRTECGSRPRSVSGEYRSQWAREDRAFHAAGHLRYVEASAPPRSADMIDPYELNRFVAAQDGSGIYLRAIAELRDGRKRSHWMWFVFPQIAGLGRSPMSRRYAIASLDEAKAYLEHPVLGPRLIESARILTDLRNVGARDIFGDVDAIKLRSSMTLFPRADSTNPVFRQVLDAYFDGVPDEATDRLLERA